MDLEDQKGETYTLHTISSSMDEKNKEDNGHITQEDNGHVNEAFEDNNI